MSEKTDKGDFGILCPGCDTPITVDNAGGYRAYCRKCVDNLGEPPAGCRAFVPRGRYQNLYWECVEGEDAIGATRRVNEHDTSEF